MCKVLKYHLASISWPAHSQWKMRTHIVINTRYKIKKNPASHLWRPEWIEEPRRKRRGIFDRKEFGLFLDSLADPAASGGECARCCGSRKDSTDWGTSASMSGGNSLSGTWKITVGRWSLRKKQVLQARDPPACRNANRLQRLSALFQTVWNVPLLRSPKNSFLFWA